MPQMSPMWWEMLYLMFLMSYLITNMMIYWNKSDNVQLSNKKSSTKLIKWMW